MRTDVQPRGTRRGPRHGPTSPAMCKPVWSFGDRNTPVISSSSLYGSIVEFRATLYLTRTQERLRQDGQLEQVFKLPVSIQCLEPR